jgi:hypothetical protein
VEPRLVHRDSEHFSVEVVRVVALSSDLGVEVAR